MTKHEDNIIRLQKVSERLDKAFARRFDPDTSHQAKVSVDPTKLEQLVYNEIENFGDHGCIHDQVEHQMYTKYKIRTGSISPRYARLMEKGLIIDTGERRKAMSGRNQRVMMAKKYEVSEV